MVFSMVKAVNQIDVTEWPDLLGIAEQVNETGEACALQRNGEVIAVVVPPGAAGAALGARAKTKEDWDAFARSFGGWKGLVDTDKLIEDIYESRRRSPRPPVEL